MQIGSRVLIQQIRHKRHIILFKEKRTPKSKCWEAMRFLKKKKQCNYVLLLENFKFQMLKRCSVLHQWFPMYSTLLTLNSLKYHHLLFGSVICILYHHKRCNSISLNTISELLFEELAFSFSFFLLICKWERNQN